MQQEFLGLSPTTWNVIFLVIRYVLVALLLAYLTNVYVKKKDIHTDIRGRVLEWRVDTYKTLHRWVMRFKRVVAAPSQEEMHFRSILSLTRFKIGYQGMEYASFFDSPERLLQFRMEFDRLINKEGEFVDYKLKHKLLELEYWLDDVVLFYRAFLGTEHDERWGFDEEIKDAHYLLACRVLGIALQDDVNTFYGQIDEMLRDRLRNIKIAGVYTESLASRIKKRASEYCEKVMDKEGNGRYERAVKWFYFHVLFCTYNHSQICRQQAGLMTIFTLVHFEEQFAAHPEILKNHAEFIRLTREFNCRYAEYLDV